MTTLDHAIHAVLAAACAGDALGAATEGMHRRDILAVFGGPVTGLEPAPPKAPFAGGMVPGRLTDDATQMLCMAEAALAAGVPLDKAGAIRGMLAWMDDTESFTRFAGPTTRVALEKLKSGVPAEVAADPGVYSCVYGTTNGAAMRAPIAGCLHPGAPDAAALRACILASPTHNTQIAYAGAGALAAAIAHGLGGGDLAQMIDVALAGAHLAAEQAERVVGGPDIARRLQMAAEIGTRFVGDPTAAMVELEAVIGNGVAMAEAVPVAFGLVLAARGSAWQSILAAVNGGNDSDTIAMFAGAVAAAYGSADLDAAVMSEIERVNSLDLAATAKALSRIATP